MKYLLILLLSFSTLNAQVGDSSSIDEVITHFYDTELDAVELHDEIYYTFTEQHLYSLDNRFQQEVYYKQTIKEQDKEIKKQKLEKKGITVIAILLIIAALL